MLGCFLHSYFSGSFRTSWPSLGCIAKTMRVPATSYCLQASPRITLSPGKPHFHPWHFSQWLSALQFGVSLELFILPALSFLGVFLCYSARFAFQMSTVSARHLLFASILYLPLLLAFLALDKK